MKAARDVLGAQRWPNGALFDDVHRGGQRTGTQQQGGFIGFHRGHAAGDLHLAPANLATDHRRGDHFTLALFDEQDGHAFADVVTCDIAEDTRAGGIKRQVDSRFLRLAVETGLGVIQALTGEHDHFLDENRAATTLGIQLGGGGDITIERRLQSTRCVVYHADFQRGGTAENIFGFGRILYARQLDYDAVRTGLLDDRLGNAQFVNPVVQRGDVLFDGKFLNALDGFGFEGTNKRRVTGNGLLGEDQIGLAVEQYAARLAAVIGFAEADDDSLVFAANTCVADVLITQECADVGRGGVDPFGQSTLQINL